MTPFQNMQGSDSDCTLDGETGRVAAPAECALNAGRVAWKVNGEIVLLLGWGRAILLQLAHPLVACAIADHSDFNVQRLDRLHRTLDAMLALTFGNAGDAARVSHRISAAHRRVCGRMREPAGIYPAESEYSACDPVLLRWVHATALDSFLCTYELYVGPLTSKEKDEYCAEASRIEPLLGIPCGYLPKTVAELREYIEQMVARGEITVTETARNLAREIFLPLVRWPGRAIMSLLYLPTIGSLPPLIRDAYGFPWNSWHLAGMLLSAKLVRALLPLAPPLFRRWPAARRYEAAALGYFRP